VSDDDLGRYSAPVQGFGRMLAQHLVMKPYIWSALTVHIHGRRNLTAVKAPFIAIANHSSHLDTTLIYGALPRRLSKNLAAGAAADYFFTKKVKSMGTRLFFNAYPIDRGGMRARAHRGMSGRLLDDGVPLLIFPEGTRSRTGAMARFTAGVAGLSISHDVQVLPIALVGAYAAMPSTASVPVPGRPDVHIVFGNPMRPQPGEIARQFSGRLQRYVTELHDTTARAYGMPTQADFARAVALRAAARRSAQQLEPPADKDGSGKP